MPLQNLQLFSISSAIREATRGMGALDFDYLRCRGNFGFYFPVANIVALYHSLEGSSETRKIMKETVDRLKNQGVYSRLITLVASELILSIGLSWTYTLNLMEIY